MTVKATEELVLVPKSLVGALLQVHASFDGGLADDLHRLIAHPSGGAAERDPELSPNTCANSPARKYAANFLGVRITAWTLPEIFADIVDLTADVAPEALDKLAGMCARRRRFVARSSELVHPGRPDLSVMRTASGWWISKNIGQEDLKRALRALAQATALHYGKDVMFPVA